MTPFQIQSLRSLLALVTLLHLPLVAAQTDPRFAAVDQRIASGQLGPINSLLIQQGETLLHESYFNGSHAQQLDDLFSVTKSVGATLIGMAEYRGMLNSESSVPTLLPQYPWSIAPFANHAALRLHDLLTMRHGLLWDEWSAPWGDPANSFQQMQQSADWYRFVLTRPRVAPPDTVFTYSTGVSTLLSGVLRQVGSLSPEQAFLQWLAQPLGIQHYQWAVFTGVHPPDGYRRTFPFGDAPMGVGLRLRARDLLPIGELYLNRGIYGGQRLLDAEWIDRAWTMYSHGDNDTYFSNEPEATGYGYQWWHIAFLDDRGRSIGCWYASGAGRQYLFVCPSLQLIVASTSALSGYDGPGMGTAMRQQILPAFELVPSAMPQVSGLWFDPTTEGQGLNLQMTEGGLMGFYYGYADGVPLWLVFDVHPGPVAFGEQMVLTALAPQEGVFGAPLPPELGGVAPWGTLELRFDSCSEAHARLEGLSGAQEFELVLLSGIDGFDAEDCTTAGTPRPMADASGTWFDPQTAGQGWNLLQTPAGLVAFFYGYDQEGAPLWLITEQLLDIELGVAQRFDLLGGQGGAFDSPVPPAQLQRWGEVEFEFESCRSGIARISGIDGEQEQQLQMLAAVPGVAECMEPQISGDSSR